MAFLNGLTADRLRELLNYDPETGVFTWKLRTSNRIRVGDVAGCLCRRHGYVVISVDGVLYKAHRLAWLYVHGRWPNGEVDHRHGKEAGNAIGNLREADRSFNMQNQRRAPRDSKTGLLGVSVSFGKFEAVIAVNHKRHRLGRFASAEEAHAAYLEAKRRLHAGNTL